MKLASKELAIRLAIALALEAGIWFILFVHVGIGPDGPDEFGSFFYYFHFLGVKVGEVVGMGQGAATLLSVAIGTMQWLLCVSVVCWLRRHKATF